MSDFEKLVWQMRCWQMRFFHDRDARSLQQSKELEQAVDKYLNNITQPEIFG